MLRIIVVHRQIHQS